MRDILGTRLLMLAAAAAVLASVLIGAAILMFHDSWLGARAHAEQVAGNLVISMERDILRNIELYDLSLNSTITALGLTGLEHVDPQTRQAALFDSLPRAPNFGPIIITDAAGTVIDNSASLQAPPHALADRDWFIYLRAHPEPELYLSLAPRTPVSGRPALVLSRRINRPDGSFGGAVAGLIYVDYFQNLFSSLDLDGGNVAVLTTTDNRVVSRHPYDPQNVGRIIQSADMIEQIASGRPSGVFQHVSVLDKIWRLYVFRHVGSYPLVMHVGLTWEGVYGDWARKAVVIGILSAGFALVIGLLFLATRHEWRRRLKLQSQLCESEASFRLLAEHASDMVTRVGPNGDRLYASPASLRMFRVSPETLVQTGVLHFVHRDDRAAVHQFQRELLGGAIESGTVTFRVIQAEKGEAWVESTAASVIDPHSGVPNGYVAVLREVTERKRAEASVAEANRWLVLSEQVGNLGHWRYNPATGRLHWSDQVYRIYGLDPNVTTPTLQMAVEACHPLDRQPLLDLIAAAIDEQAGFTIDVRLLRTAEDVRHVQIRAVVETWSGHGMTALFGVVVDVTDQVRAASALQDQAERERHAIEVANSKLERLAGNLAAARDEAQKANRAKSRFLAGMSHELRTPLNGILGYAHLLARDGGLTSIQTERIGSMLAAGQHLLDMVNQVLSLAEVECGRTELRLSDVEPAALAASCLDLVRPSADAKGLQLDLSSGPDVPALITTDATRLRQVVLNILGNAVKFTAEGTVALQLCMTATGMLRLDIVDSGPGVCPTKRHRLFQDFDRLDAQGAEGAGLGLALSAQLAAALGGRLNHEDNPGGGSRFSLELPVEAGGATPEPCNAQHAGPVLPAGSEARRILVVDDVAVNRDIAASFLRTAGYRVELASDGAEAVAMAEASAPDLILMDVRMPGMDGLQATRLIRRLPGPGAQVPIVALTAQAFADQIEECHRAGMDSHLTKPFTPEGLLHAVAAALATPRPAAPRGNAGSAPPVVTDGETPQPTATPMGSNLPVLNRSVLERTASYLDRDALQTYLAAIAGRSRELSLALAEPDALVVNPQALAAAAHTLAGSAAMLGFDRLSELSRRLEHALEGGKENLPDVAAGVAAALAASLGAMDGLGQTAGPALELAAS